MKQMGVREFLRGGYHTITEPTLVSRHSHILFTVFPHDDSPPRVLTEDFLDKIERLRNPVPEPQEQ